MHGLLITSLEITRWFEWLFWPFIRIAAMFSIAPMLGSRLIPVRIRVLAAILITITIAPTVNHSPIADPISFDGVITVSNQIVIGLLMGFILQLVFNAVAMAGEAIAMTMGLGFAQMIDPQNGMQMPVVSQFLVVTSTLLFVALNGHAALIYMLVKSFEVLPIASSVVFGRESIWGMLEWVSNMFAGAALVALPAISALLVVNLAMGVITRSAPQLNIFSIGFPATMLIGFLLLFMSLPSLLPIFSSLLQDAYDLIDTLLLGFT